LAVLTGSTALFDLRLLGYGKFLSVKKTADFLLPLAHLGFFLVVLSGTFLFLNDPRGLMNNTAFQIKILLILLAGINAFVFYVRKLKCAEIEIKEFSYVKAAAICSIFLWIAIIALGRLVAYI
jgi:high-affinity Fe2+/Pb2+ permease